MMFKQKDNSNEESSLAKLKDHISDDNLDNPDDKNELPQKGNDFEGETEMGGVGFQPKASKSGNCGSQELTLSYLCDNSKLFLTEKEIPEKFLQNAFEKSSYKGKEVVTEDQNLVDQKWVVRDFLQLNENRGNCNSSKREVKQEEIEVENREKKPKLETLNLSLGLPGISLSLAASNHVQNAELPVHLKPSRSLQSLAPSNNNTQTTYSNDFTAASMSYPFSHNPSCSLTHNSTDNYENSMGSYRRDCDQIWNCGEGTNGSVHSRFRPVGDGVALVNHGGGGLFSLMQSSRLINKDSSNTLYRTTSSDNLSFFPSELPAMLRAADAQYGDSRGRGSDQLRGLENIDGGRVREISRSERILREIVSESIPMMAQIVQEFTDETVDSTKEHLKNLITEKREELIGLQNRLLRRSDLTSETLAKSNKNQLEILVAIKMGLTSYLSTKNRLPVTELIEIFLLGRCRNVNCKRLLPVEDCDCKICSTKKGFCSECMCPVCLNFDCASNTCSWVGCDVCSHWCHASCGIQRNLLKPGLTLKGQPGTTEMQFHCLGCGHASEMFGFVKDVFMSCAKTWDLDKLMNELDCVRKIFRGSEDFKGKELRMKADKMLSKLQSKTMSAPDVCGTLFQFFKYTDGVLDLATPSIPIKESTAFEATLRKDIPSLPPKSCFYSTTGSSSGKRDILPHDLHSIDLKPTSLMGEKVIEDEWSVKLPKREGFDSLESVVRVKEAEARMFQSRADEARRESEGYRRMIRLNIEKLEEEYSEKTAKLCIEETEEKRRKKLEELKDLENSHCDYHKMKMRMQDDIAGLLERMESTKKQWA